MDNARDKLDRLIDGALASYSGAEPLAGLEARVMNRVCVVGARRRWLAWGVGLAVAASVVVGVVSWSGPKTMRKKTPVAVVASIGPQVAPRQTVVAAVAHRADVRVKRAVRPRALPKLEQFPTPTPLTAEERALVAFIRRDPKEAERLFADWRKRTELPIEIQPVQIAPLLSEDAP